MRKNLENKVGLYLTIIFHLVVVIVLLVYQIDSTIKGETSFVLDFTKQEELEKEQKEEQKKVEISKRLEDMIAAARASQPQIKNIAVDASNKPLKDDRNTDAEQLYKDAEKLARELKNGQGAIEEDAREETVDLNNTPTDNSSKKEYSGPSVVSYSLDGRKASHLKVPAYRCYGSGDVVVIITVDPQGRVVNAQVMEEMSSSDPCHRKEAIRAARLSRFSVSTTAPARQTGEIIYRYIAQ